MAHWVTQVTVRWVFRVAEGGKHVTFIVGLCTFFRSYLGLLCKRQKRYFRGDAIINMVYAGWLCQESEGLLLPRAMSIVFPGRTWQVIIAIHKSLISALLIKPWKHLPYIALHWPRYITRPYHRAGWLRIKRVQKTETNAWVTPV